MKTLILIVGLGLAACGGKKTPATSNTSSTATAPAAGSAAQCCCSGLPPDPAHPKAGTDTLLSPDDCKAKNGTCGPEADCHGIEGPIP